MHNSECRFPFYLVEKSRVLYRNVFLHSWTSIDWFTLHSKVALLR